MPKAAKGVRDGLAPLPLPSMVYWKLWEKTGDPKALLAFSQKIGEENG